VYFTYQAYISNFGLDIKLGDINKERDDNESSSPRVKNSLPYIRYDEAGIRPIPGTARSHHLPFAIPESRTIPRHLVEDMAYHISQLKNTASNSIDGKDYRSSHDYSKDNRTLYIYNPHILPLHNTIEITGSSESDPDFLSKSDLHALTGGDSSVRYLATYRAFTGCNCFGILPNRDIMAVVEKVSYLAIALLDEHLDVINGTDVLVDFNLSPPNGDGNRYFQQFREDCRTFLVKGHLQIVCNSLVHNVRIRRTWGKGSRASPKPPSNGTADDYRVPYIYENMYGDGLEITLVDNSRKLHGGKNLNIFRSSVPPLENTNAVIGQKEYSYEYYLQIYPIPHVYNRLTHIQRIGKNIIARPEFKGTSTTSLPLPSFDTADTNVTRWDCKHEVEKGTDCTDFEEVPFLPKGIEHGTSCCVSMDLEGSQVMVGIAHVKLSLRTKFWMRDKDKRYDHFPHDQFLSSFIAYNNKPPFDIVARSGLFCLEYANEDEGRSDIKGSALAGRNTQYRMDIFDDTFDCPSIHFASSFSEVVGDQTKAIIGYGKKYQYTSM